DQKNAAGTDAEDGAPPAAQAPTTAEDGAHDVGTGEKAAPATTPPATSLADSKAGALPFALAPAPDPALVEKTSEGLLPIRGADGRVPWQAYSRPFLADPGTPKIALVVIGLGLSEARTRAAIEELPGEVTLAFSPYGRRLQDYAREARAHGHETLVMVPMEPRDYPANDPGPLGLLTKLTPAQNLQRLRRILGRFAGHVGIVNDMGSRFSAEREALSPVIAEIGRRGLLVLDARTTARSKIPELAGRFGVPFARNDRHIDNVARGAEIDRYLAELETLARRRGQAVGIGHPYPITIARIRAFAEGLQTRGLVLAPVSAVVEIPTDEGGEAR
ncbi:MAG: divergent polysaccharide deacetylase family protein, partial [Alphaproteobacteria bacterium]